MVFRDFLVIFDGCTEQYTHESIRLGKPDLLVSILLMLDAKTIIVLDKLRVLLLVLFDSARQGESTDINNA